MVLLFSLVPGGGIENRDFSHIPVAILGAFNIFLTSLGIVSLLLLYFIWQRQAWAYLLAAFCGLGYFVVYLLDLAKIFPVSPTAMSSTLLSIEVIGCALALPLMVLATRAVINKDKQAVQEAAHKATRGVMQETTQEGRALPRWLLYMGLALFVVGIVIVIFATRAAMR